MNVLIIQHLPFIFLITLSIYTVCFVMVHVSGTPEQEANNWLVRHPKHSAGIAVLIFLVVSLLVISLSTDIL